MTELLKVENLNGYYGTAHVLQGVSFSMGVEAVAMIGRNGMGKTTLCKAIVGLLGATGHSDGSVQLEGEELHGAASRTRSPRPASATCRRAGGCSPR